MITFSTMFFTFRKCFPALSIIRTKFESYIHPQDFEWSLHSVPARSNSFTVRWMGRPTLARLLPLPRMHVGASNMLVFIQKQNLASPSPQPEPEEWNGRIQPARARLLSRTCRVKCWFGGEWPPIGRLCSWGWLPDVATRATNQGAPFSR